MTWAGEENGKFPMVFQFEHLGLWNSGDSHFDVNGISLVLNRWQNNLKVKVGSVVY